MAFVVAVSCCESLRGDYNPWLVLQPSRGGVWPEASPSGTGEYTLGAFQRWKYGPDTFWTTTTVCVQIYGGRARFSASLCDSLKLRVAPDLLAQGAAPEEIDEGSQERVDETATAKTSDGALGRNSPGERTTSLDMIFLSARRNCATRARPRLSLKLTP